MYKLIEYKYRKPNAKRALIKGILFVLLSVFMSSSYMYPAGTESVKLIRAGQTISNIAEGSSDTVDVTLSSNYPNSNLKVGQSIAISSTTNYNGTFTITTVTDQSHFSYAQTNASRAAETSGTAGGHYTTLTAWEAGEGRDLRESTGSDEIAIAECYDDWADGLDDSVTIDGFTTDATHYVKVIVPATERHNGSYRADGVDNTGFRMNRTDHWEGVVSVSDDYTVIEGVVANLVTWNTTGFVVYNANDCIIKDCIAYKSDANGYACGGFLQSTGWATFINCIFYNTSAGGFGDGTGLQIHSNTQSFVYNCTFSGLDRGIHKNAGVDTHVVKNCAVFNNTDDFYVSPGSADIDNCASDDGDGTNAINISPGGTEADDWANIFVDYANGDFHIKKGSVLVNTGLDLSDEFTTSNSGDTRTGPWDIGADQADADSPTATGSTVKWDNTSTDGLWSTASNWDGDAVPVAGDNVVFDSTSNTACEMDTVNNHLASISLNSGYTNTVTMNTDCVSSSNELTLTNYLTVDYGTLLLEGDTTAVNTASGGTAEIPHGEGCSIKAVAVTVGSNGKITAEAQGFPNAQGPGAGNTGGYDTNSGGTYGGSGGPGSRCGNLERKIYGSATEPTALGSGGGNYSTTNYAGGAGKFSASGTVTVNGTIDADGEQDIGRYPVGASGGSVWIIADTLAGSGTISAKGGADGNNGSRYSSGGGGGRIAVDYNTSTFTGTIDVSGGFGPFNPNPIRAEDGRPGTFSFPDGEDLTVKADMALASGEYNIPTLIINANKRLDCQGDVTAVNADAGGSAETPYGEGVTINSTNITVNAGASIIADNHGFIGSTGPGKGTDVGSGRRKGAGYGGVGGYDPVVINVYGSPTHPTALGSGGGTATGGTEIAMSGGGAIKLNATGTFTHNGTISANGGYPSTSWYSDYRGGGSGGSVWVAAATLAGTGTITANGGNIGNASYSGSGGGGRILIQVDNDTSSVSSTVTKGTKGYSTYTANSTNGTIVWAPIGGYTAANVIPEAQCSVSTDGNGIVTITFKIQDPGDDIESDATTNANHTLKTFEYSIDGGTTWNAPTNDDSSGCLGGGWPDNDGSDYTGASTFASATGYTFTFNTKHADVTGISGLDQDDVQIRFTVKDTVTQRGTDYTIDSSSPVISENFTIDGIAPNAPSMGDFTATGGTVVANTLNGTNTGFTLKFISPATEYAGTAHLYVGGELLANDVTASVSAASTEYTLTGNAQSITDLGSDGVAQLSIRIVDSAGNVGAAAIPATVTLASHTAGDTAPVTTDIAYGTVITALTGTNMLWITQNLGATQQATAATDSDAASAGWYWQFNRKQGYTVGSPVTPAWTVFSIIEDSDWTLANDPCTIELGTGWRLPTNSEWIAADTSGAWTTAVDTYDSVLKIHSAGACNNSGPANRGTYGYYWSSTQDATNTGKYFTADSANAIPDLSTNKATSGFSVRCLKEPTIPSSMTISHTAGDVAPVTTEITYGIVYTELTGSGMYWISQNLGASQQATSATDDTDASAGWYWQFNRKQGYEMDGSTRTPDSEWITSIDEDSDWLADRDPCTIELGTAWRLPTQAELANADSTGGWVDYNDGATGTYGSVLKLHAAGYLHQSSGNLLNRGAVGGIWSSTQNVSTLGRCLYFDISNSYISGDSKARSFSVRCLSADGPALLSITKGTVAPNAPTLGTFTATGGTVVAGYVNNTNTGFTLNFTSPATLYTGTAHLYIDGSLFATDITTPVSAGSTEYTLTGDATSITGLGSDGEKQLSVRIIDSAGNASSAAVLATMVVNHTQGEVAPVTKEVTYGIVTSILTGDGAYWITQNLGATNQATSATDATEASAGWYWQFNRKQGFKHDGTTRTPTTAWITSIDEDSDWEASKDPCAIELGIGWRLPTEAEWTDANSNGEWGDYNDTYASVLKLHAAGSITYNTGSMSQRGVAGYYRGSNQASTANARFLNLYNTGCIIGNNYKAYGLNIRCIKDTPSSMIVNHTAGDVAPVSKTVTYGVVYTDLTGSGQYWITQNLGADNQATSATDNTEAAAGWYWQFNRKQGFKHDGTTRTPTTAWITPIDEDSDWTSANDPCTIELGTAWRLPTSTEWTNADSTGAWDNYNDTYTSVLKLHTAGYLHYSDGASSGRGTFGYYGSSTHYPFSTTSAMRLHFVIDSSSMDGGSKASGYSIRCLSDTGPTITNIGIDTAAPSAPVGANITVTENAPGSQDTISGTAGAVENSSTVKVYKESGLTTLLGSTTATGDGSFSAFDIGDNQATADLVYVVSVDSAGNVSNSTSKDNDTTPPNAPSMGDFTATGGTVVANTLNGTNTGFTLKFISPATEYAGTAHLYLGGALLANDVTVSVSAASTEYDLTGNAQSITDLGADGAKELSVKIIDDAGNIGAVAVLESLTVNHTAGDVAPVTKEVTYGIVGTDLTGSTKYWITQNLGADNQATAYNDVTEPSAGWYWQFNRKQGFKHDGTTRTPTTAWITSIDEESDWTTENDPCTIELGTGWRLPTSAEWTDADNAGGWTNYTGPFNSVLKLHCAGKINGSDSNLNRNGGYGNYRGSTQWNSSFAAILHFHASLSYSYVTSKNEGYSIRCLTGNDLTNIGITLDTVSPTVTDAKISITSTGTGAGGVYLVGDTVTAQWNNTSGTGDDNDDISTVTCDFSALGGGSEVTMTNASDIWTGSYDISTSSTTGTHTVDITATDNAGNTTTTADTTDIEVGAGTLTMTSPAPGTTHSLCVGATQSIEWTAAGDTSSVVITYSTDSGSTYPNTISTEDSSTGSNSYDWTIPYDISTTVRLRISDADESAVKAVSTVDFSIVTPTILLTDPDGGEDWYSKASHDITWTTTGSIGTDSINLYYSHDSGSTYSETIATGETDDSTYTWTLPFEASYVDDNVYMVKAEATFPAVFTDTSDANFGDGTTGGSAEISGDSVGLPSTSLPDDIDFGSATPIYRSVGPGNTSDLAPANTTVTISGSTATFSDTMPDKVGVGDVLKYGANLAFIHGRTSSREYTVKAADGTTPTATSAGTAVSVYRAYTSLNDASYTGNENTSIGVDFDTWTGGKNIETAGEVWNIACYADATDTTTALLMKNAGWGTDPTHYIRIYTPFKLNEVGISQRHNGTIGTGYRLIAGAGRGISCTMNWPNVIIDGLIVKPYDGHGIRISTDHAEDSDSWWVIKNCLIQGPAVSSGGYCGIYSAGLNAHNYIYNNIVYDYPNIWGAWGIFTSVTYGYLYNNTVVDCISGGIRTMYGSCLAKNNISINNQRDYYTQNDPWTSGSDYNIAGDTSSPDSGTHNMTEVTLEQIAFVDYENDDFRISFDSVAKNAGANFSNDADLAFSHDVDNLSRPYGSDWDIGASEYWPSSTSLPADPDFGTATPIYRSVGPANTSDLNANSRTVEIVGSIATFSDTMPDNMGVGDVLKYGANLAFIHGRVSDKIYRVKNAAGAVPTATSAGTAVSVYRAYTSLEKAVNTTPNTSLGGVFDTWTGGRDIATANEYWNIACYADADDTECVTYYNITGSNWITGPSNYMRVYTPYKTSEVGTTQRHNGTSASGYTLAPSSFTTANYPPGFSIVIDTNPIYFMLDGLVIKAVDAGSGILAKGNAGVEIISNNIIEAINPESWENGINAGAGATLYIYNNVVSGFDASENFGITTNGSAPGYVYNNTVYNSRFCFYSTSTGSVFKNNIAYTVGGTALRSNTAYSTSSDYNVTNDSSLFGGDHDNINADFTNTFLDSANNDFRLSVDDTEAKDLGANLSGDAGLAFSNDADGLSRPYNNVWDIGASEYWPAATMSGTFTSQVFDTSSNESFGTVSWTDTNPAGTTLVIKARTSNDSEMSGATDWASCSALTSGQALSDATGVTDGHRYIQYYMELGTTDTSVTPSLSAITLNVDIETISDVSDAVFTISNPLDVADVNIDVTTGAGPYIINDTVTVTWDNTVATGDGAGPDNPDVTGATCNFSLMEGGAAVTMYDDGTNGGDATADDDIWTASYDIQAGTTDTTTATVSVTATDGTSVKTTADTTNLTVDNIVPVLTDANISITSTGSGVGGVYLVGDTVTAQWDDTASTGENNTDTISTVTCDFSSLGGGSAVAMNNSSDTWTGSYDIATTSNTGTWTVDLTATDNAGNTTTTSDTTDIEVGAGSLTLTSPDPDATHSLRVGATQSIGWSAAGDTSSVIITYSTDSGSTYPNTISTEDSSTGSNSYDWTIPYDLSTTVRIKITDAAQSAVYALSDVNFTIAVPEITITSPNGTEQWYANSSHDITWEADGDVTHVKLEYSTDGGSTYPNLIAAAAPNSGTTGSYSWTLPFDVSSQVKVRGTDASGAASISLSGSAADKVSASASSYESDDKTLVLDVLTDFVTGDDLVISGLYFTEFSISDADNLELDIYNSGIAYALDDKTIKVVGESGYPYIGGTGDGWDSFESESF